MHVKRIAPKELSADLIFQLNHLYKIELGEFVTIADRRKEILYVNHKVPQRDIDGFLEVIAFPYYWVADETVTETGKFLQYVYDKYGFGTYSILIDAHSWQMEKREKCKAKEAAKAIIPLIEKEVDNEEPIVQYDERLIGEIWSAGLDREGRTPKNVIGFRNVYVFYLGYLMGAGMLKDVAI